MRINKDGGHFGSTENDVNLKDLVQEFAWLDFLMLNPTADIGDAEQELNREIKKMNKAWIILFNIELRQIKSLDLLHYRYI